ncbi:hypothetical protein IHE45_09G042400 [Dioscorea alata]|uniref:Uncharacterized protein n=1 Tax=Dioscorea alata TaxID=55571 RepID=A0ACB7VEY7_DIOAL|nr:hypothetical protein IHE45_09G042400 [Dioscorea alata]
MLRPSNICCCGALLLNKCGVSGDFSESSFRDWLSYMIHQCSLTEFEHFLLTVWALWKHKNEVVWKHEPPSIVLVVSLCEFIATQWMVAYSNRAGAPVTANLGLVRQWMKPLEGILKINYDTACFKTESYTRLGWIVRNHRDCLRRCGLDCFLGSMHPLSRRRYVLEKH